MKLFICLLVLIVVGGLVYKIIKTINDDQLWDDTDPYQYYDPTFKQSPLIVLEEDSMDNEDEDLNANSTKIVEE